MSNFNKIKYDKKIILAIATLIFLVAQCIFILPRNNQANLDDTSILHGDSTYYLDGAKSILEYNAYTKFNDKKQPIIGQKNVNYEDLPRFASQVALAYPNSSFKFGYSLTAALVTGLIPNHIFEKTVSRLVLTNFILSLFSLLLIILILGEFSDSVSIPLCVTLFYCLDTFGINNNYMYQSHTICGVFFALLASYIVLHYKKYSWSYIVVGGCISFSALSSSHILPFDFSLASLILISIFLEKKRISKEIIFMLVGLLIWPVYILFVEWYIDFRALGIPTFIDQYRGYASSIKSLIDTYPILQRQIWHIELWNLFIVPMVAMIASGMMICKFKFLENFKALLVKPNFLIIIVPIIIFILITSIYSQPILRAVVPNLLIFDITLGVLVGILIDSTTISFVLAILVLFLTFVNYAIYTKVIIFGHGKTFWTAGDILNNKSGVNEVLRDTNAIWSNVRDFFNDPNRQIDSGNVGIYSKSLKQYLQEKTPMYREACKEKSFVIEISPTDIVENYSHTRRYISAFQPNQKNLITTEVITRDFRLINELIESAASGKVELESKKIVFWHPSFFDQEYNYVYGFNEGIKKYLKGTSLYQLDFHKLYYINLCPLLENE